MSLLGDSKTLDIKQFESGVVEIALLPRQTSIHAQR